MQSRCCAEKDDVYRQEKKDLQQNRRQAYREHRRKCRESLEEIARLKKYEKEVEDEAKITTLRLENTQRAMVDALNKWYDNAMLNLKHQEEQEWLRLKAKTKFYSERIADLRTKIEGFLKCMNIEFARSLAERTAKK